MKLIILIFLLIILYRIKKKKTKLKLIKSNKKILKGIYTKEKREKLINDVTPKS